MGYVYRLLIAEENEDVISQLESCLDWRSYQFHCIVKARSYGEALSLALDTRPHVALVDVNLGDRWGWELAEQLSRQGMETVFAMVSDIPKPQWMRKAMQAKAQDFFLLPIDGGELREFVERVIVRELGGALPDSTLAPGQHDPVLGVSYESLSKITNMIILYTQRHYRQSLSLITIAEELKMSSKYIGRVFLQDTGMKYSQYLMAWRMLAAQQQITGTQDKISVIANMVGYSQLNNFYIHFKRYFGVSPGELRNLDEKKNKQGDDHESTTEIPL